jgi:hypothetical protein
VRQERRDNGRVEKAEGSKGKEVLRERVTERLKCWMRERTVEGEKELRRAVMRELGTRRRASRRQL